MQPAASPLHVEAAVSIEQAKLTLLGDDAAESEIARWIFDNLRRNFLQLLVGHQTIFSGQSPVQ